MSYLFWNELVPRIDKKTDGLIIDKKLMATLLRGPPKFSVNSATAAAVAEFTENLGGPRSRVAISLMAVDHKPAEIFPSFSHSTFSRSLC